MLLKKNQTKELIKSLSELQEADYTLSGSELAAIYDRLQNGRIQFEKVLQQNITAVMQISSLDLTLHHYTENLEAISRIVADATKAIHASSEDTSDVANAISSQHEELTNTIIAASEESRDCLLYPSPSPRARSTSSLPSSS